MFLKGSVLKKLMVSGLTSWGAKLMELLEMKSCKMKQKKINKKQINLQKTLSGQFGSRPSSGAGYSIRLLKRLSTIFGKAKVFFKPFLNFREPHMLVFFSRVCLRGGGWG